MLNNIYVLTHIIITKTLKGNYYNTRSDSNAKKKKELQNSQKMKHCLGNRTQDGNRRERGYEDEI